MTKEEFIKKANLRHNDKYDYSLLPKIVTYNTEIEVICNEKYPWGEPHGVFRVKVGKHLHRGDGCTKCSGRYKRTKEDFVKEATYIHNGLYTYDDFVWCGTKKSGIIHCIKHNIDFKMTPGHHLDGQGCPKCRYEKLSESKKKTFENFVEDANKKHGTKYIYVKETFVNTKTETKIICPKHGEFWMTPSNHTNSFHPQGCPVCGKESSIDLKTMKFNEFVYKANKKHNNKYKYNEKTYINASNIVDIFCQDHGWFQQKGVNHLNGQSCPKCSNLMSIAEEEICTFIKNELGISDIQQRNRMLISPYELDLYIPSKKIAIEYNGLVWHSTKFNNDINHLINKYNLCKENGIRLIHIYEDEWLFSKKQVQNRISSILQCNKTKIYARNCLLKEINSSISKKFLNENHIQGNISSKYRYGLFYNNELVSVMTFCGLRKNLGNKSNENSYELLRFCNKIGVNVVGGASKLLKKFIKDINPQTIISYADKRWSNGNLYEKLGFEHTHDSKPNYFYVVGKRRENRFKYRKNILVAQGFDSNKSEREIMEERGIPRIYDCGCMCFKKLLK